MLICYCYFLQGSIFYRANQERLKIRENRQKLAAESEAKNANQVPSIKLTMDFSKFAAK